MKISNILLKFNRHNREQELLKDFDEGKILHINDGFDNVKFFNKIDKKYRGNNERHKRID